MYCTTLLHTALYYTTPQCTALECTTLHCTALRLTILDTIVLLGTALHFTVLLIPAAKCTLHTTALEFPNCGVVVAVMAVVVVAVIIDCTAEKLPLDRTGCWTEHAIEHSRPPAKNKLQ